MGGFVRTFFPYSLSSIREINTCFNHQIVVHVEKRQITKVYWKDATKYLVGFFSVSSHVVLLFSA